ncbi:MAG: alpha/beta hydrolase [Sinobacteraceae bacterium]|nr:alpha/beta hydrolase [Nevskiaceae bacterium]
MTPQVAEACGMIKNRTMQYPPVTDSETRPIRRGFVQVDGRHVHYRVCGSGPAVVMLHDSPRSSLLHARSLQRFGDEFTVYALDTPGYGHSDPLPATPRPEIEDFADALAGALRALGLDGATIYAFHTSSKIAVACAVRHPQLIGHLLLDGISIPAQPSPDEFIERYMSPFVPDTSGAYIAAQWTKIRDLHRYFPWFDIRPAARMPTDEPSPEALHEYAVDLFSAGPNYAMAYSAAMRYAARPAVAALSTPTTVIARADDVLFGFLDAVEQILPPCGAVRRLPADDAAWQAAVREAFGHSKATARVTAAMSATSGAGLTRRYQWLETGSLMVREGMVREGGEGRALVMLHSPPGSSADLAALAATRLGTNRVWAPDLPGCGLSDPLPTDADGETWVAHLLAGIDAAGLGEFDIHAVGLASPLALQLARRAGARVGLLTLDGGLILDAARRAEHAERHAPPLLPDRDGTQLWRLFHRLRDEALQWPWFDGSRGARRGGERLNAESLYRRFVAALTQLPHYGDAGRVALQCDPAPLLAVLPQPIEFIDTAGDPFYAEVAAARSLRRSASS